MFRIERCWLAGRGGSLAVGPVFFWAGVWLLVTLSSAASSNSDPVTGLRFVREGEVVQEFDRGTLSEDCGAVVVEVDDPYYERTKRFYACPVEAILTRGFGKTVEELRAESFLLRAADGFVKPVRGATLFAPGGFAAFADADLTSESELFSKPVWEPIDRRQVDPGPFYLVWVGVPRDAGHAYPRPYQWVEVEIASLEKFYPHIAPRGVDPSSSEAEGYSLFVENCIACHAINGEGGKVGPDLNIPRSIVEYRPVEQVKAFIRDPASFRYTTMPSHEFLTTKQLDSLVAYFNRMKSQKYDLRQGASASAKEGGSP